MYSDLLKKDRPRESEVADRTIVTESESDRGRILFCAAFRRLQQKAQVFSMEPNAAVRSRLTHSLEVSQIGRYIADSIAVILLEKGMADTTECMALVTFVESACLMHDIGNPPFGHFGEAAIQKWFADNGTLAIEQACAPVRPNVDGIRNKQSAGALADFLEFDGNPQGLRVVAKLQWNKDEFGLNLTKTTLASYLKYIRKAGDPRAQRNGDFDKKAGYFSTEADVVEDIWKSFGYTDKQRFPLAYIMEAADDIAYCISDLEDSIEKNLLDEKKALTEIKSEWSNGFVPTTDTDKEIERALECAMNSKAGDKEYTFTDFRTGINRAIVKYVTQRYIDNHTAILSGSLDSLIPGDEGPGRILNTLKAYCKRTVYCHESVQRTELAGYTAIFGLLDHFRILLTCSKERFLLALDYTHNKDANDVPIIIEKKYLKLFPERYIKVYKNTLEKAQVTDSSQFEFLEWNARAHLIVDFISGMTDDFAMTTYRTLSGMRL